MKALFESSLFQWEEEGKDLRRTSGVEQSRRVGLNDLTRYKAVLTLGRRRDRRTERKVFIEKIKTTRRFQKSLIHDSIPLFTPPVGRGVFERGEWHMGEGFLVGAGRRTFLTAAVKAVRLRGSLP